MNIHQKPDVAIDGHTVIVTLANPPANTWTRDSPAALCDLVRDLDADRDTHALTAFLKKRSAQWGNA